jgi:hypothetical protein
MFNTSTTSITQNPLGQELWNTKTLGPGQLVCSSTVIKISEFCFWHSIQYPACQQQSERSVSTQWHTVFCRRGTVNLVCHLCHLLKKVKCTLVQALRLCTGPMVHRRSTGIVLLLHDHSTRKGWGMIVTPWPLFTPRKDPVPIVQEAGWAPGPIWTGAENLTPTRILSPDRSARSQFLYQLRYSAHVSFITLFQMV